MTRWHADFGNRTRHEQAIHGSGKRLEAGKRLRLLCFLFMFMSLRDICCVNTY